MRASLNNDTREPAKTKSVKVPNHGRAHGVVSMSIGTPAYTL